MKNTIDEVVTFKLTAKKKVTLVWNDKFCIFAFMIIPVHFLSQQIVKEGLVPGSRGEITQEKISLWLNVQRHC